MHFRLFILLMVFLWVSVCFSQPGPSTEWLQLYNESSLSASWGYSIIETTDDSLLVAGAKPDSTLEQGIAACLLKIGMNGEEGWSLGYPDGRGTEFSKVIEAANNDYIAAGVHLEPQTGFSSFYIVRTNSVGEAHLVKNDWNRQVSGAEIRC